MGGGGGGGELRERWEGRSERWEGRASVRDGGGGGGGGSVRDGRGGPQ